MSPVPTARSEELRALAQRLADVLPADVVEEVVVTGSVSRGVADEVSDVEMLVVTSEPLELEQAYGYARAAGLTGLDSWGPQGGPDRRTSGYFEGVPFELIWWPREFAEARVDALAAGDPGSGAEALVSGIALRSSGLLPGRGRSGCASSPTRSRPRGSRRRRCPGAGSRRRGCSRSSVPASACR